MVVNAAARALIGCEDDRIFPLLMGLAQTRAPAGVVAALGSLGCVAALAALLLALREDHTRMVAEAALLQLGEAARPALAGIATQPIPSEKGRLLRAARAGSPRCSC